MSAASGPGAPTQSGMITIEVVDDPSFWDYAGDYIYYGVIALFVGVFIWRRLAIKKKKS